MLACLHISNEARPVLCDSSYSYVFSRKGIPNKPSMDVVNKQQIQTIVSEDVFFVTILESSAWHQIEFAAI